LLVIWNHCEMPPRHDGAGVYGGRDALHAAISSDDGASWRGFREIYRDPTRDESPPKRGDRGTAYANAVEIDAGKVLVATGQGPARRMLIVDPDWLLETRHSDDFSAGLQAWSVFKSFGPAIRWWRDRTTGAGLVTHPDTPHRQVLHLGRAAGEEPDGAVWNFPAGQNVTVTLRTRLEPNFGGATIALVDRFFEPTDRRAVDLAIASCTITPNGQIGDGPVLSADGWHEIRLACRVKQRDARLLLDGALSHPLAINEPSPVGVSYLWISSDAQTSDTGGLLVERVSAEVEP
jgi:hypothetical protein